MKRIATRVALAAAVLVASLAAVSPAAACLRTLQVRFEPDGAQIAEPNSIAAFLDVPTYGNGQMISIKAAGPVHDLARRRALALADLLQAQGQSPSGIMIETARNPTERTSIIVYPPPTIRPDPRFAQAAPPTPTPPRRACGS